MNPIDILLSKVDFRCLKCNAKMGECDCFSKCPIKGCTWFVDKGKKCRNPEHKKKKLKP